MSVTVRLAQVLDELDIGQLLADCLLMVLSSRRKLVTNRDKLWPAQGGTEDTDERAMTSHTEMCDGCEVTSGEEAHVVERVTVRSDVVKETKSVGEAQPIGNGVRDANNSPNREQDQGPYTLALKVRYLQACVRSQTRRVIIVTINCQERASTRSRSNTCSDLKDPSMHRNIHNVSQQGRPEQADRREAQGERKMELERGHGEASCESCVTYHPVQSPSSKRSARRKRNTNHILARSKKGTRSHLVILSVKDDQKTVQDNALPKRMNRLIFESDELGRTR